jgi:SAM-dependent methyltransferase
MFEELEKINSRPKPFEFYTADDLWTDEHTSKQMLSYHLNEQVDLSSRNTAFIDRSVDWNVTGIDFSKNSIQYAKTSAAKQGLNICYTHQNYLDFVTEKKFDLITMIMCDFCALSPTQRSHMLNKFHTLLKPDGSLLLDVYSLAAFDQYQESATYQLNQLNGFWSGNKYYGFLNKFKYEQEKVTLDKYTIVEASRTRTIYNWLQYFTPETLKKEFKNQGLTIEEIYSNVAGSPHTPKTNEFAIIAKTQ